jgi:hypothetical protein
MVVRRLLLASYAQRGPIYDILGVTFYSQTQRRKKRGKSSAIVGASQQTTILNPWN